MSSGDLAGKSVSSLIWAPEPEDNTQVPSVFPAPGQGVPPNENAGSVYL